MLEYLKNVNLQELKDNYMDNHGFALISDLRVKDLSIEILCNMIINKGITKDFPVLVTRIKNAVVFIYDKNTSFNAPQFFSYADFFNTLGVGEVMPLLFFLKQNN